MSELSETAGRKRQRSSSPSRQQSDLTSPEGPPAPLRSHMEPSSPTSHLFSPPSAHALSSEVDLSSPLTYGTPSSRIGGPGSSRAHTPIRPRSDIGSQQQRMREINLATLGSDPGNNNDPTSGGGSEAGPDTVIWGTDVNIMETKKQFVLFLRTFVNDLPLDDGGTSPLGGLDPYYLQKLEYINVLEEPCLNVNAEHIKMFNPDLYAKLVRYPQEVIPTFDLATNEVFNDLYPDHTLPYQIQVRPYNVDHTKNMRLLNPEDIDQLINISGMVIRTSPLIPEMREAFFQCYICHDTKTVEIDRGRIAEPAVCTHCQSLHSMMLIHNRSWFTDKQMIKLQESPEDMPSGQTPHTIHLYSHHDLVDKVQPGDRITVTGIYRAVPVRVNPRARTVRAVFKTYIDVIHFKKTEKGRLREREDEDDEIRDDIGQKSSFPPERIDELIQLSKTPDIYERLAKALAPSIYENDDIKKGILLQLFGGSKKDFDNTGHGRFRSEINILLCGDPGTSKSQLLKYIHNLMPRGQYTSGKGSSAVGLTAYVTKDPETRQLVLQTGALVLSDNGICCIDEFDKMNEGTRSVLHEVMEQQTLSIAKAGIICSLNARTSILAAANPRMSRWDERLTVVENIQLPHTLLSRFDLIFLMLDPQDEQFDRRLATHLVSLYHQTRAENEHLTMDMATLRDYIAYSRTNIQPTISDEAGQSLIQAYVDMRKIGSSNGAVTAYPRQLESLIRLSEAHAKMRFSKLVEIVDVEEAKRLHREALKQAATDPLTGIIDVSILTTGMSASERQRREILAKELRKLLQTRAKAGSGTITTTAVFEAVKEQTQTVVTQPMLDAALKMLQDEEFCVISAGTIRLT